MTDKSSDGELFSRFYIERGAPEQDSQTFRTRLAAYLEQNNHDDFGRFANSFKRELGLHVPMYPGMMSDVYKMEEFLSKAPISKLLSCITLTWRVIEAKYSGSGNRWRDFVERVLEEENLGYSIDGRGGIRYRVDEEFERNRVSALRAADLPRYAGVRAAFEAAHKFLDEHSPNTKFAVRSIFEAIEILARLMDPPSKNLNAFQVKNKLLPIALSQTTDAIEQQSTKHLFDGLADWVDAMHPYRHGQGLPWGAYFGRRTSQGHRGIQRGIR